MDMKEIIPLAWPLVVLAIVLTCVLLFRPEIRKFLGGVESVDVLGFKANSATTQQIAEQKQATEEPASAVSPLPAAPGPQEELLADLARTPLQRELVTLIRAELQGRGLDVEGPTVDLLIQYLADANIAREFEFAYSLIFGSQIRLMKHLNELRGVGATKEQTAAFYTQVQATHPELNNWSLEEYLTFPLNKLLICIERDNYHITRRGIEFLQWMPRMGRTENKHL